MGHAPSIEDNLHHRGRSGVLSSWRPCLSGCATTPPQWVRQGFKVGPNYCPPPAPVAAAWLDGEQPEVIAQPAELAHWWRVFDDPVLDELEATAACQNLPLKIAAMRILEARATLNVARGTLWPQQQQAMGSYTRSQLSQATAIVYPITRFDTWDVGFNASWELDLWGRFRRTIESAEANLDSQIESSVDVLVILQGEVAAAYIQLRTFQERLRIVHRNVDLQEKTLELVNLRFDNGKVTELDVAQAKQNLNATRAAIRRWKRDCERRRTRCAFCWACRPRIWR